MGKQLPILIFLLATLPQACGAKPVQSGTAKDAGDANSGQLAADAASLPDLATSRDLEPVSDARCGDSACAVVPACGNGRHDWDEECDDHNAVSGDGCSSVCKVEPGFRCSVLGQRCTGICGDGLVRGAETCDDGNTANGDGCSSICLAEPEWCSPGTPGTCARESSVDGGLDGTAASFYCGDGIVSGDEECDDGPANSDTYYSGCSTQCRINRCGDGILNGVEECDCGDNYLGDIMMPPCVVRPAAWLPAYCMGCSMVDDIGP